MIEPVRLGEDVTLYLGNCLDVLPTLPDNSVDAVVTDLPYGNDTDYSSYLDTTKNLTKLIPVFMSAAQRIAPLVVITCGVANITMYPPSTWILSWHSPNSNASTQWGFTCWQPILVYGKDPYLTSGKGRHPDSFSYCSLKKNDAIGHPCPKPIGIMSWIVQRTSLEGATILDPFFGSGTTAIACIRTGRRFIGIEISEEYFMIAKKRIMEAQAQLRIPFDSTLESDDNSHKGVVGCQRSLPNL